MSNSLFVKFNCYKCNCKVEMFTVVDPKRIKKICMNCLLESIKEENEEYIPFVEEN